MRTQRVLNDYIEYNKDIEKFTKYVEVKNVDRKNKRDNKRKS